MKSEQRRLSSCSLTLFLMSLWILLDFFQAIDHRPMKISPKSSPSDHVGSIWWIVESGRGLDNTFKNIFSISVGSNNRIFCYIFKMHTTLYAKKCLFIVFSNWKINFHLEYCADQVLKTLIGIVMEPLATNRQCLIWLCVCPADERTSRWQKLAHIAFALTTLTGIICGFVSCSAFVWKFISIDVGRTMYAFTFMAGELAVIYMTLAGIVLLRHKISTVFENLGTIYNESKCCFFSTDYKGCA